MVDGQIKKVVEIDASTEAVFRALTDPNELSHWFPDAAILEPKVDGKFKFSFFKDSVRSCNKRDDNYFCVGKILEFVSNKKLVYTWQWQNTPDFTETIVTWELEQIHPNKTRLKLTHSGFTGKEPSHKSVQDHDEGWSIHLNELVAYCKK